MTCGRLCLMNDPLHALSHNPCTNAFQRQLWTRVRRHCGADGHTIGRPGCHDHAVTTVLIGGPSAALLLDAAGPTDIGLARLQLKGLKAEKLIYQYASGFENLADYFESLERDWQGWANARTWTSIESDLQIRAEHDGHIRLAVELRSAQEPLWSAAAYLTVEAGEQLSLIASQSRQLALTAAGRV